jgi:hypothetical protein
LRLKFLIVTGKDILLVAIFAAESIELNHELRLYVSFAKLNLYKNVVGKFQTDFVLINVIRLADLIELNLFAIIANCLLLFLQILLIEEKITKENIALDLAFLKIGMKSLLKEKCQAVIEVMHGKFMKKNAMTADLLTKEFLLSIILMETVKTVFLLI